jgi:hypothetical protein
MSLEIFKAHVPLGKGTLLGLVTLAQAAMCTRDYFPLKQWFQNFSGPQTTWNILVLLEEQNNDLHRDWRTTRANRADHQWSAEQTLGITALKIWF